MLQNDDELFNALESVHNEESFLQFLLALRDDREASVAQEKITTFRLRPRCPGLGEHYHRTIL